MKLYFHNGPAPCFLSLFLLLRLIHATRFHSSSRHYILMVAFVIVFIKTDVELEPLNISNSATTTTSSWKKWGMGAAVVALVGLGYNSTFHSQSSSSDGVDLFGNSSHKNTKSHKKEKHGHKSVESAPLFDEQGVLNIVFIHLRCICPPFSDTFVQCAISSTSFYT